MILLSGYAYYVARTPQIIGTNYLTRYFVIPRNRWLNIYLHKYTGSDDDRALHDHPWNSVSFLLKGSIIEVKRHTSCDPVGIGDMSPAFHVWETKTEVQRFVLFYRNAEYAHRLIINSNIAWTLFITGRKIRAWGFHCPKGWVHWRDFTDSTGNHVGKGCE